MSATPAARRDHHGRQRPLGESAGRAARLPAIARASKPARMVDPGVRAARHRSADPVCLLERELEPAARRGLEPHEPVRGSLDREIDELHANRVRVRFIGDRRQLAVRLQARIAAAEERTRGNDGLRLQIAMSYGGRWDIVQAAQELAAQCSSGSLRPPKSMRPASPPRCSSRTCRRPI